MWTPPGYPVDASIALPSHSGCQSEPCNGLNASRSRAKSRKRLRDAASGTGSSLQKGTARVGGARAQTRTDSADAGGSPN